MKLSTVHMFVGLVLIVALSFYFNQGEGFSVPHVVPFELEKVANTKEPFASPSLSGPSEPSTLSKSSDPSTLQLSGPPALQPDMNLSNLPVVSISDVGHQAMVLKQRADLLNQVQRLVRDEIRMARQLETLKRDKQEQTQEQEQEQAQAQPNPSERQGRDYHRRRQEDQGEQEHRCPQNLDGSCPPVPDLTQYIRKDQIPCWGCSVDY